MTKPMGVKTNRISLIRGIHIVHHYIELKHQDQMNNTNPTNICDKNGMASCAPEG